MKYLLISLIVIAIYWGYNIITHVSEKDEFSFYKTGIKTDALITRNCTENYYLPYSYSVNGKSFKKGGNLGFYKRCGEYPKGSHVAITYLKLHPEISLEGEYTEDKFYTGLMLGEFMVLIMFWAFYFWVLMMLRMKFGFGKENIEK
jgi:hypothetical protein